MSYIIISSITIVLSVIYQQFKNNKGNGKRIFLFLICLLLCFFAGSRSTYNDTFWYKSFFNDMQSVSLSNLFEDVTLGDNVLFSLWTFFVYKITPNYHWYFFLSSILFVVPFVLYLEKYSRNFLFSMFIFLTFDIYLFSLAAMKQAIAMGIMAIGLSYFMNQHKKAYKRYFIYYLCCLISVGIHIYSVVYLFIPFLGVKDNKRTIIFYLIILSVGIIGNLSSVGVFLSGLLGKELNEELVQQGSVSILRLLVFLVPLVLSIFITKEDKQGFKANDLLNIKLSNLSSICMTMALFASPILFGRLPYFFIIGMTACYPTLIAKAFKTVSSQKIIYMIAVISFAVFGIITLYQYGALGATDVFGLQFDWRV